MAAGYLVGDDAQALLRHPPHEDAGEELVVFAQDEPGGHVRPGIQWPGRVPDHRGFPAPAPSQSLLGQRARNSVVEADERVVVAGLAAVEPGLLFGGLPVAGAGPPFAWAFSGEGDHPGKQHEQPRREPAGRQGGGERAVGLSHDHQILPAAGRIGHGARVIIQAGGVDVARQVRRDRMVPPGLKLRLGQMPVPAGVAGAVNEHEGRHGCGPFRGGVRNRAGRWGGGCGLHGRVRRRCGWSNDAAGLRWSR